MKVGSLCTGYGGLDLAVDAVLGTTTEWVCEFDAHASKVCEARFPSVPNLHDLTTVDWSSVPRVDVLTAGFPCQPFSSAGRRQGANDDRHLWPYIVDALRILRPAYMVAENVAGLITLGLDRVLGDLAELGFDAEWALVRASDVGACHRRARIFIVATDTERPERRTEARLGRTDRKQLVSAGRVKGAVAPSGDQATTDANPPSTARGGPEQPAMAPTDGRAAEPRECGGPRAWGPFGAAIQRHERLVRRPAPAPTDDDGRLSAPFVEWMMCLPAGWVTDILPRNPALKTLGNGVVPPQAAYAISGLLERLQAWEQAA